MMYVTMIQTTAGDRRCYRRGEIYEVPATLAREWIDKGIASISLTPPPHIARLLDRLDHGAGRPCLFLPFVGEFGHLIMSHVRIVHFHRASWKVVCCRPGEECLFPSADELVTDWVDPTRDEDRVATMRPYTFDWSLIAARFPDHLAIESGRLEPEQEIHPIEPAAAIPFVGTHRGLRAEVVLGVRRRDYAPERNWRHWQLLADLIRAAGYAVTSCCGRH